jgi:hypothetical protein
MTDIPLRRSAMKSTTTLLCSLLALAPIAGMTQSATAPPPATPPPPASTAPGAPTPPASAGPQTSPGAVKPLPPPALSTTPRGGNGQPLRTPPPARPLGHAPTSPAVVSPTTTTPTVVPFSSLDRTNTGTLRRDQASSDPWLAAHFSQCDTDHNQQVSQGEYQACSARK